jgi:hypothetical protein
MSDDTNLSHGLLNVPLHGTGALGLDLPEEVIHEAVRVLADVEYVDGNEPAG